MKKTALITGAEGFIGSHLVKFLQARGWSVVGSYLQNNSSLANLPNLQFTHCDLRNGQRVTQLLAEHQPTHIFHLGAQSLPTASWADPVTTFESNIMGSLYLFEAARRMKKVSGDRFRMFQRGIWQCAAGCNPGHRRATFETVASLWNQQSLSGSPGAGIFSGLRIPAVNIRLFNTTGPGKDQRRAIRFCATGSAHQERPSIARD